MKKIKRGVWQLKCWWWGTSSNYRGMLRSPGNVLITLFLSSKLPPSPLFVLLQCSAFAFYLWQWKIGISWLALFCQNFQFCINEMRSGKRHRGKVIKTQCGEYNEMVHTNSLSKDWTTGRVRKYLDSLSTTAFFFQILMVENVRWGSKPQPMSPCNSQFSSCFSIGVFIWKCSPFEFYLCQKEVTVKRISW